MENAVIIQHLHQFLVTQEAQPPDKQTADYYASLRGIPADGISLGSTPSFFFARLVCNSTGVGTSSFGDTETQRTVALDYTTDELLFIDGHIGAGAKGLSLFYLKPGETVNYYDLKESHRPATAYGYKLHEQSFHDLNFQLKDHRLNRHEVKLTRGPFRLPIRPIFATLPEDGKKITIGYLYENDGQEHIIIEPDAPEMEKDKSGCAPWMFLGFIFPPILIVAAIKLLVVPHMKQRIEEQTGAKL